MDPATIELLTKLGFTGLAVWLVYDTRQEARKREDRMAEQLGRAQAELVDVSAQVSQAVNRIAAALEAKPCLHRDQAITQAVQDFNASERIQK